MKAIPSTMAGTVLNVLVENGDEVSVGQTVVTLESMKMVIRIDAEIAGKVSDIKAIVGDFVNEGDVLLVLEQS
jgi:acetyl-CoA carboxylase biotin carboxyl carrier protein